MKNNIVLIGMPGAGKSTVGVVLAKALGYAFADTDLLISAQTGTTLQSFIDSKGIDAFLKAEERAALSLDCERTVVATGGSMVLSEYAMSHLKSASQTVFLDVPLDTLIRRIQNITTRGITLRQGQTIADIYGERQPLYKKYADITVPENSAAAPDLEGMVAEILKRLK